VMEKTKNFLFTCLRSRQIHAYKLAKANLSANQLSAVLKDSVIQDLKSDRKIAFTERLEARKKRSRVSSEAVPAVKVKSMSFLHAAAIPFLALYYALSSVVTEANEWRKTHGFFGAKKKPASDTADELTKLPAKKKKH